MMIQGDRHIEEGETTSEMPSTWVPLPHFKLILRIRKQSQRGAHNERPSRPEILDEAGTKTPLSPFFYAENP